MENQFYITKQNRQVFINLVDSLTTDQLNEIPEGFNNNIAWNFAHIVVSQQILCYAKAGKEMKISKEYIDKYQRGSKPESYIEQKEVDFFKEQAIQLIVEFQKDWVSGIFDGYQAFTTSMGVRIENCEEALHYAAGHDQLHFGYCLALRKAVLYTSLVTK
jgi:hypothetical protein